MAPCPKWPDCRLYNHMSSPQLLPEHDFQWSGKHLHTALWMWGIQGCCLHECTKLECKAAIKLTQGTHQHKQVSFHCWWIQGRMLLHSKPHPLLNDNKIYACDFQEGVCIPRLYKHTLGLAYPIPSPVWRNHPAPHKGSNLSTLLQLAHHLL